MKVLAILLVLPAALGAAVAIRSAGEVNAQIERSANWMGERASMQAASAEFASKQERARLEAAVPLTNNLEKEKEKGKKKHGKAGEAGKHGKTGEAGKHGKTGGVKRADEAEEAEFRIAAKEAKEGSEAEESVSEALE